MSDDDTLIEAWLSGEASTAQKAAMAARLPHEPALAKALAERAQLHRDLSLYGAELLAKPAAETAGGSSASGGARPRVGKARGSKSRRGRGSASRRRVSRAPAWGSMMALAAAMLVAAWFGWQAWQPGHQELHSVPPHVVVVALDGSVRADQVLAGFERVAAQAALKLEDRLPLSATLRLAEASACQLRTGAGDMVTVRGPATVTLAGQVWRVGAGSVACEVTPRAAGAAPFVVATDEVRVVVLGTRFTVSRSDVVSTVQVERGRVAVHEMGDDRKTELGAGDTMSVAGQWARSLPAWTRGRVRDDCIELESVEKVLSAGFGDAVDERHVVLRYHPDTRVRIRYRATAACHWIGLWWRNRANGHTYHVPMGPVQGGGDWVTVEARLGDAQVNGEERTPQAVGDGIHAFTVQTGNLPGAAAAIAEIELLPPNS
ncbi:MAG: FecR domain-containing protein [Planctomycetota bacterium]|jgi:hypothetical protein|nr:FecR domain-containing protein [Planctomycetota bacterium]